MKTDLFIAIALYNLKNMVVEQLHMIGIKPTAMMKSN